jgi:predicted transcriptional regulator
VAKIEKHQWIGAVHNLLKQGYGVEDIAIMVKADVRDVRNEVKTLRSLGVLANMFQPKGGE